MATETMKLRGRPVTAEEATLAVRRLINSHFRNNDQARCSIPVDPMDDDVVAGDYVLESEARIAELKAKLAALDWTPITPDNLPRLGDHLIRLNSSGTIGVSLLLDQWDGEYPTMDYCMNFTYRRPINPPQEPK